MRKKILKLISKVALLSAPVTVLGQAAGGTWADDGLPKAESSELPGGSIVNIITNLMMWLLILLGAISIIGFVIAGILYLTSAGDEERMEKAKRGMIYSIIGVIVGLVGYVIVKAVDIWLRGNSKVF